MLKLAFLMQISVNLLFVKKSCFGEFLFYPAAESVLRTQFPGKFPKSGPSSDFQQWTQKVDLGSDFWEGYQISQSKKTR